MSWGSVYHVCQRNEHFFIHSADIMSTSYELGSPLCTQSAMVYKPRVSALVVVMF